MLHRIPVSKARNMTWRFGESRTYSLPAYSSYQIMQHLRNQAISQYQITILEQLDPTKQLSLYPMPHWTIIISVLSREHKWGIHQTSSSSHYHLLFYSHFCLPFWLHWWYRIHCNYVLRIRPSYSQEKSCFIMPVRTHLHTRQGKFTFCSSNVKLGTDTFTVRLHY